MGWTRGGARVSRNMGESKSDSEFRVNLLLGSPAVITKVYIFYKFHLFG